MKSFVQYLEKGEVGKAQQLMRDCCYDMFVSDCYAVIGALNRQSYESDNSQAQSMLDKFKEYGLATTPNSLGEDWKQTVIDHLNNGNDGAAIEFMGNCGVELGLLEFERWHLLKMLKGAKPYDSGCYFTQYAQAVHQQFVDAGLKLSLKSVGKEPSWRQAVMNCINIGNLASASDIVDNNTDLCIRSCDDIVEALRGYTSPNMTDEAKSVLQEFRDFVKGP